MFFSMCVQVGEEGLMDLQQSQQVACFKVLCFSSQVTMWRMSWEKRLVPSPCTSESSPGNLPSGSAWKRSACEAVKAMISILRLQLAPRICTLGLVGLSQFSLSPPPLLKASLTASGCAGLQEDKVLFVLMICEPEDQELTAQG